MTSLLDDVRSVGRSLVRSPRHVVLTATCLALGLGVNALMFGVVDTLFLRPPAGVREPSEVVRVYFDRNVPVAGKIMIDRTSFPVFTDLKRGAATSLEPVAAYYLTSVSAGRGRDALKLRAALVTADYFRLVGAIPAKGRLLQSDDSRAGSIPVAVISNAVWDGRFGSSPSVIGRRLLISEREYTIVGVAPRDFTGVDLEAADVWLPLEVAASDLILSDFTNQRGAWVAWVIGRLNPKVTTLQAEGELTRAFRNGMRGFGEFDSTDRVTVAPLLRELGPKQTDQAKVSKWLEGVALAVLLIACVNCASLMLFRAARRQRDFALRMALGATRLRLARIVVLENVALAVAGAVAAAGVAGVGLRTLRTLLLPDQTSADAISLRRLFVFTFVTALAAGLATGLPALRYLVRGDLTRTLRGGARAGTRRSPAETALLVGQIALTVLLLVGAGLFVTSLRNARALDMGFQPSGVTIANIDFSGMSARRSTMAESPDALYQRLERAIRALPGIASVGVTSSAPFQNLAGAAVTIPGRDPSTYPKGGPFLIVASEGYFSTIGLHLVAGRWFESADYGSGAPNAVINETMARTYWPGESALGKCLVTVGTQCHRVVGIIGDTRRTNLREASRGQLYLPGISDPKVSARIPRTLVMRTVHGADISSAVRRTILSIDPRSPYITIQSLQTLIDPKVRPWTLGATMFALFGCLALVLAAVGLYGSMSCAIADRTHEIGVRMALGATNGRILTLVLGRVLMVIGIGVALGGIGAYMGAPRIGDLLLGVQARSSLTFGVAILVVIVASVAACWSPLRRAMQVDPLKVLNTN